MSLMLGKFSTWSKTCNHFC